MATPLEKTVERMAKDIFSDFLTIAIHSLLHSRQVYPVGAFKLRQKFNIPVQICYHPEVFAYITEVVTSISEVLQNKKFHALNMFIGTSKTDWERITIRLLALDSVKTQSQLTTFTSSLKACLLKLSIIDTYLQRHVSDDITWRIEIEADSKEIELNHADWMKTGTDSYDKSDHVAKLIPLKTVSIDCMKLEMFITKLT
ncbi:mitotic spindle assembly checkpoint protein MAD2B-like [Watersipora subatra]|uniref:mitotic spindle assembly checkpoint protein MAD2B-like n=1 Tax=Watersipora subatra TaxID=2589382 RepID=UPI00355AD3BE